MQQMNSASLLQMSSKQLKNYIRAYNLSAKAAIEKDDLVRIILNTRPISNDSEVYYRNHRHEHLPISPPPQQGNETGASSTISQMFNDLFSGGGSSGSSSSSGSNNAQREAERQRRQQEERIRQQQQRQRRQEEERMRQQRAHEQHQRRMEEERIRQQQSREQSQRRQEEERMRQQQQQQQQQSTRKEDTVSVDEMILSKMDPKTLSVKTLKAILRANFVEQSHALEKSDLVSRVQWLIDERRKELSANDQTPVNDDSLCRICCDAQQNCVFLDCGHMVTCMDCGKQVINTVCMEKKREQLSHAMLEYSLFRARMNVPFVVNQSSSLSMFSAHDPGA